MGAWAISALGKGRRSGKEGYPLTKMDCNLIERDSLAAV
jgi:LacI family transcriptional regulator